MYATAVIKFYNVAYAHKCITFMQYYLQNTTDLVNSKFSPFAQILYCNTLFIINFLGYSPTVTQLTMNPISNTSINISWGPPTSHDCYTVDSYSITCRNPAANNNEGGMTFDSTSLLVTGLTPNTAYQCSVKANIHNKKGDDVAFTASPARGTSYTLPNRPKRPSRPEVVDGRTSHNSFTVDLSMIKIDPSVSVIQIIVVRLLNRDDPQGSPETLYPTSDNFYTYDQVHNSSRGEQYRAYIAAQLNANELPETFVIGNRRAKRSNHIENGALAPSSFYTCFLRLYSSWIGGQTFRVHESSVFMFPVVETADDPSTAANSSFPAPAVIVPLFLLFVIVASILVVLAAIFFIRLVFLTLYNVTFCFISLSFCGRVTHNCWCLAVI